MTPGRLLGVVAVASTVGCGDAQLDPYRAALEAYEEGRADLDRGDAEAAASHFADAMGTDPASAALPAWRARALEQAGRRAEALSVLDDALLRQPGEVTLRYNRAAYRARAGDLAGAAADLRYLVDRRLLDPLEAGADPDFAALAEDPNTSALAPPLRVEIRMQGEAGSVVRGDSWTLMLEVLAPADAPVDVRDMGHGPGLLRLERIVEDVAPQGERQTLHTMTVTWRAVGGGKGRLGPWLVAAGGTSALADALDVAVVALGESVFPPPLEDGTVWSPAARLGGRGALWAGRVGADIGWIGPPGSSADVVGVGLPGPVGVELRSQGQTQWIGQVFVAAGGAEVTIRRGNQVLLQSSVPAP